MPYTPTNWKDLPSNDTPINAASLNKIEEALYSLTIEEAVTVEPEYPWVGTITLKRRGNRVEMSAELTGGDPWNSDNVILFTVPEAFRPKTFVIVSAYTGGSSLPLQYAEVDELRVFYLNIKLVTKPANSTDVIFNTFYFTD